MHNLDNLAPLGLHVPLLYGQGRWTVTMHSKQEKVAVRTARLARPNHKTVYELSCEGIVLHGSRSSGLLQHLVLKDCKNPHQEG